MGKIFKYEVGFAQNQVIDMPRGATILALQVQYEKPVIWALVDPDAPCEPRTFVTVGTGHEMPPFEDQGGQQRTYIGTYQVNGGRLVFHVFEET